MKPVVNKAKNFKQAEEWDIKQHISMTSEERQRAARELRERTYGKKNPDVREAMKLK